MVLLRRKFSSSIDSKQIDTLNDDGSSSSSTSCSSCSSSSNLFIGFGDGQIRSQPQLRRSLTIPFRNERQHNQMTNLNSNFLQTTFHKQEPIPTVQSFFVNTYSVEYCTTSQNNRNQPILILKILYSLVIVSWIAAYMAIGNDLYFSKARTNLESQVQSVSSFLEEIVKDREQIQLLVKIERQRLQEQTDVRNVLLLELQTLAEQVKADATTPPQSRTEERSTIIRTWWKNRRETLIKKIQKLQNYLQEMSRRSVTEQYVFRLGC